MQRNEGRISKLEDISRHDLDEVLCRFFAEIRKKAGHKYEPESLAIIQCSLDRHLKNCVLPLPTASSNFGCPQNFSYPIISKLDNM